MMTGMYWAESQDWDVTIGETWQESLTVYTDDTQTETVNLTGMTVVLIYDPPISTASVLIPTTNSGLTGVVFWSVQTAGWEPGIGRWALKITDGSTISYPAQGSLFTAQIEMLPEP